MKVIPAIAALIVNIFYQIFLNFPLQFVGSLSYEYEGCDIQISQIFDTKYCIREFIFSFGNLWSNFATSLYESFASLPFADIVIFLVIWTLAAYSLQFAFRKTRRRLNLYWWLEEIRAYFKKHDTKVLLQNLTFVVVLGLGAYLSLAAIAAIPILQTEIEITREIEVENLVQQLETEQSQYLEQLPEKEEGNPFAEIEKWMDEERDRIKDLETNASNLQGEEKVTLLQ